MGFGVGDGVICGAQRMGRLRRFGVVNNALWNANGKIRKAGEVRLLGSLASTNSSEKNINGFQDDTAI